jgi:hypothetical protein
MRLFNRKPKPLPPPSVELPAGEEIVQAVRAMLLNGADDRMRGVLHMTNRRLMFEAEKGEARWMIVPYDEMKAAGLYPWPGAPMGIPSSLRQCLVVTTTKGEQVWWDFDEKAEREWLPLVQAHIAPVKSEPERYSSD